MTHDSADLVALFAREFSVSHRTRLVPGGDEPLYRPAAGDGDWNEIVFRHDYFQSALHEIAHWCVAGAERRTQTDYGYWYSPDGRTRARQAEFERVEARPQAVEWILTVVCGRTFRVSLDNLDAAEPLDDASLWRAVQREAWRCLTTVAGAPGALPPRAAQFARALAAHYGQDWPLTGKQLRDYFALSAGAGGAEAGSGVFGTEVAGLSGIISPGGVNVTV